MIFAEIPNYEGYYEVSTCGVVRSMTKRVKQHHGTQLKKGKILSPAYDRAGYLKCALSRNNKLHTFTVHQLVARTFIPNPKRLNEINHKDGNKSNNHISNLEWCDRMYNMTHARENNLLKNGSKPMFSEVDIKRIINLRKEGFTAIQISVKMNCHKCTIYRILQKL